MPSPADPTGAPRPADVQLLRAAVVPALAAGAVAVVVAAVGRGAGGAGGALAGVATVVVFFGLSLLVLRATREAHPSTALGLALMTYTLKVVLLAVALVLVRRAGLVDRTSFGWAAIVTAVAWLVGEIRGYLGLQLALDPDRGAA